MNASRESLVGSFDRPGFLSDSRPEIEKIHSISPAPSQSLFFCRYQQIKAGLGLLEPTPLADRIMVSVITETMMRSVRGVGSRNPRSALLCSILPRRKAMTRAGRDRLDVLDFRSTVAQEPGRSKDSTKPSRLALIFFLPAL